MRIVGFLSNMALGEMYGFDEENILKVLNAILNELKGLRKDIRDITGSESRTSAYRR